MNRIICKASFIVSCCLLLFTLNCHADVEKDYASERERMVVQQIEARGISDMRVLQAMRKVQRHQFVPAFLRNRLTMTMPCPSGKDRPSLSPTLSL